MTPSAISRRSFLPLVALLLLTGPFLGCHSAATPAAEEKVPPAPLKWEGLRQLVLEEWTELVGTTQPLPDHAARVTAPVEGRVISVLPGSSGGSIVEGQVVHKGDALAQLDATVITANRNKALAAKKVLQADKEVAELAVKQAALEVKRLNELKRQQDAAKGGLQLFVPFELEKADVALESAQAHVRAAQRKLESADEEVAALNHEIQLFTLTAPRGGRLGRLQVVAGQTLAIGTLVAEVIDIAEEIDVLCFVPAGDARKLVLGQPAHLGDAEKSSAADPEGKIVYIATQAEAESGLIAVKVRFPNRDVKLRANAVVRLRILTRPGQACWAVPEAALVEDQDPPGVVVVEDIELQKNADGKEEQIGKARRLRAILGVRDRVLRQVEVLRLEDPDKKWQGDLEHAMIVVEKGQGVQTGDAVRLEVEEDEEPAKPEAKPEAKP